MAISYLINTEDMSVLRFRNKRSQTAAMGDSETLLRVTQKTVSEDLAAFSIPQLTTLYNNAVGIEGGPEEEVKKFKNKEVALENAVAVLELVAEDGPNVDPPEGGGSRGRKSQFAGLRIYKNEEENPRRADSHGYNAWEIIEDGMTFEAYMEAVAKAGIPGGSKHLKYDYDRGRVTIE